MCARSGCAARSADIGFHFGSRLRGSFGSRLRGSFGSDESRFRRYKIGFGSRQKSRQIRIRGFGFDALLLRSLTSAFKISGRGPAGVSVSHGTFLSVSGPWKRVRLSAQSHQGCSAA